MVGETPDFVVVPVGEVEVRFGKFVSIAVSPVAVEVGVGVARAADVAVISRAGGGELALLLPGLSLVGAGPKCDFAAGPSCLRAGIGRTDDGPVILRDDVERAGVVVMGGCRFP